MVQPLKYWSPTPTRGVSAHGYPAGVSWYTLVSVEPATIALRVLVQSPGPGYVTTNKGRDEPFLNPVPHSHPQYPSVGKLSRFPSKSKTELVCTIYSDKCMYMYKKLETFRNSVITYTVF